MGSGAPGQGLRLIVSDVGLGFGSKCSLEDLLPSSYVTSKDVAFPRFFKPKPEGLSCRALSGPMLGLKFFLAG